MKIITLGIAIILGSLFPIGDLFLARLLFRSIRHFPDWLSPRHIPFLSLLATYVFAVIVAVLFVRMARLQERLPEKIPGRMSVMAGLILFAVYIVLVMTTLTNGFTVGIAWVSAWGQLIFRIPAGILIVIGVTHTLLATSQQASAISPTTNRRHG